MLVVLRPAVPWDWRGFLYPTEGRMSDDVDRVVVFMDYQNVHGWARRRVPFPFGADPSETGTCSRLRSANCCPSVAAVIDPVFPLRS